ncbi:hypothetical protein JCM8547_009299 [Rhodosporidiobolus lusitaniae]
MGKTKSKKDKGGADAKAAAKAAKKAKNEKKAASKDVKQVKKKKGKDKEDVMEEDDFLLSLEQFRAKWAEEHKVTEDIVEGPPSRRANATLTSCPVSDRIWLFGGEVFDGQKVTLYADLYRYDSGKNEWRHFTSPTQPGPRSAHQVVGTVAGGGKLWVHGGEYSAPNQSSFYHYRDLWSFDLQTHSWEQWETKVRPSGRSGHRMCVYKGDIYLFGGFQDTGIRTTYLNDLWVWSLTDYRWTQIEFGPTERKPPPRSGFSFLPTAEGLVVYGGYSKTYEGKRVKGEALNDCWLLKVPQQHEGEEGVGGGGKVDVKKFKWEKRKNPGYPPNPTRSGCTMAYWANKGMGILFGGVSDNDVDEESLESTFYNELYGYNTAGHGRWVSLQLKRKKKPGQGGGGQSKKKKRAIQAALEKEKEEEERKKNGGEEGGEEKKVEEEKQDEGEKEGGEEEDPDAMEEDSDDDAPKPWEIAKARAEAERRAAAAAAAAEARAKAEEEAKEQGLPPPKVETPPPEEEDGEDADDPEKTVPGMRYNAMLAVQKNTLFLYGGILEAGNREYTLADFHTLQLDKMDRYRCLREDIIDADEWQGSDSENDDDSDDDDEEDEDGEMDDDERQEEEGDEDDDGKVPEETEPIAVEIDELALTDAELAAIKAQKARAEQDDLTKKAEAFMGVAADATRAAEDIISTPLPNESLAQFFARSKEYWTGKAHEAGLGSRGKDLRKDGFGLAQQRYEEYKPILDEIVRLQEKAGLDAAEVRTAARAGLGTESRNRR